MNLTVQLTASEAEELTAVDTGVRVTAAAESRTITGLVAPYNVYGMTSAGKVKFLPGSMRLPDDLSRVKLLEHHSDSPGTPPESVGHAISSVDTPEGLVMTFKVATTQKGNDALTAALEKAKDSLSVELIQVDLHRDEVRSAYMTAVAQVPVPAFATARVLSIAASHHEPSTTQEETMKMTDEQKARLRELRALTQLTQADAAELATLSLAEAAEVQEAEEAAAAAVSEAAEAEAQAEAAAPTAEESTSDATASIAAAHAPATLAASTTSTRRGSGMKARTLFAAMARLAQGERSPELTAALEDVAYSGSPFAEQPEYVGELWSGADYERRYVPLLDTSSPLTSLKVTGWRWVEEPTVDDWAGDKADVPSNPVSWSEHPFTASRLAGAHDIAREWFDFGDSAAIEAFYRAQAKNYKKKTDQKALAAILSLANGSTVVAGNLLKAAAVAAQEVEDRTDSAATSILVNPVDKLGLLDITGFDVPAYLRDVLGIEPGNFKAAASVPAGTVVALHRRAIKFRELPGVPIRVTAENIAQGGRDSGLFGYWLAQPENPDGVRKVTFAPAA